MGAGFMDIMMQKANLLADNILQFVKLVNKSYQQNKKSNLHYQLMLMVEDFKFQSLANEIKRVNNVISEENYTLLLVERFKKGMPVIEELVGRNYDELYIFTAKIYTLKNLCTLFNEKEELTEV
jgi:hypothetical protein